MARMTIGGRVVATRPLSVRPGGENVVSRGLQVLLCIIALALLSPVMLLVALPVKATSRGPVFYRGSRVGMDERIFTIYKFRTLQVGAEKQVGARLLKEEDQVYTPVGKFLKKWKLDELPQLFNVIRGDMSLVGPRPEQADLVAMYGPEHHIRLSVKPGVTGPMQVFGRGELSLEERIAVERDYIENLSVGRDLRI